MDVGLVEAAINYEQLLAEPCDRYQEGRIREEVEARDGEEAASNTDATADDVDDANDADDTDELNELNEDNDNEKDEDNDDDNDDDDDDNNNNDDDQDTDKGTDKEEAAAGLDPNRLSEYIKEKHARLQQWTRWLIEVGDRCPICYVEWARQGRVAVWQHKSEYQIQQCPRIDFEQFRRWRSRLDFGEYDCCWRCGLPQSMCRGEQDREHGSQGFSRLGCEWGDPVKPLLYWIRGATVWQEKIRECFRFTAFCADDGEWHKQKAWLQWLGRARRMYDEDMTNAIAVWDTIVDTVQR